jgi:hypothetical protein
MKDVLVVPVGVAFWFAEQQLPQIDLFVPDVLACVLYSVLCQQTPEGNIFSAGLEPAIALKLQKLSWLVTTGFYK